MIMSEYVPPLPSAALFAETLSDEAEWYTLGTFLGAPVQDLNDIEQQHSRASLLRRYIEVYNCLERRESCLSWEHITTCLRRMKRHQLAGKIHSSYIQSSLHSSEGNTTTAEHATHSVMVVKDGRVNVIAQEFETLRERFDLLIMRVKRAFQDSSVSVEEVRGLIEDKLGKITLQSSTNRAAQLEEVFEWLKEHCSFLQYRVLIYLVDNLLKKNMVIRKEVLKLKKAVENFKSFAKMNQFVDLIKEKQDTASIGKKVQLKVRESWSKLTMKQFETVVNDIIDTEEMLLIGVQRTCICVNWVVPSRIDSSKLVRPDLPLEFVKLIGVIYLHIGNEVIFEWPGIGCETIEAAMLQAVELKNTRAIEVLLAMGCSPVVATYNGNNAVTNIVNIREKPSVNCDDTNSVNHVCVLDNNDHVEAIIDPSSEYTCNSCSVNKKMAKKILENISLKDAEVKILMEELKKKENKIEELVEKLKNKDAEIKILMEKLKGKDEVVKSKESDVTSETKTKDTDSSLLLDVDQTPKKDLVESETSYPNKFQMGVTIDTFVEELLKEPNKDWYTLGFLLGLFEVTLKEIGFKHRLNGIDACLREIFNCLQSERVILTWEMIVDALSTPAMGNEELAEQIRQKYCSQHKCPSKKELKRKDEYITKLLTDACCGRIKGMKNDDNGFFLLRDILEKHKGPMVIYDDDIRRVVAGNPLFMLKKNKGKRPRPLWRIRANEGHVDVEIARKLKKEKNLLHFVTTVCRFGPADKKIHFQQDGSILASDILSLRNNISEEDLREAVRNSTKGDLILMEDPLRVRNFVQHPPEGSIQTSPESLLWSDLRTLCCEGSKVDLKPLHFDEEGYVNVKEILEVLNRQRVRREVTEESVRRIVEDCPAGVEPDRFALKKSPTGLQIKATWGHERSIPQVKVYDQPKLVSHHEIQSAVFFAHRKYWATIKKEGLQSKEKQKMTLTFDTEPVKSEREMLEKYWHNMIIIEIDVEKALKDGYEFRKQLSVNKLICMDEVIPPKYFKRIY